MTTSVSDMRCAVRSGETETQRRAIDACLADRGLTGATHFLPKDDDDLADALAEKRFDCVVFADYDALLAMIWKGDADLEHWHALGICIELAVAPEGKPGDWQPITRQVSASLRRWRKRHRRRQVIAALILSMIALLAVATLLTLIPPAG